MADIATLGLEVKFDSVEDATDALGKFTDASAKAEKGADGLSSKTGKTSDGLGKVASEGNKAGGALDKVEKSMGGAAIAGNFLIGVLGGIAAGFSVKTVIDYADAWSDMQSRVGAAIGNMEAAPRLMRRIVDIANASYSPLAQTAEIYARNVSVLRDLGRTADETADFTEALNHALVITATKGQQAESVQNALAKAMALGKLQAEGLETVLANGGRVAELLAEQLGTTVSGLRQMATDGKITGDVIAESLIGNLDILRAQAEEMPATVGDAFVRIQTNAIATIGSFDQLTGASGTLAAALIFVADNMDRIITTAATATVAFGTYYVGGMVAAAVATGGLTGALRLLRMALVATGIGALVVVAGELVFQFMRLVTATGGWGNAFKALGAIVAEVWDRIVLGAQAAGARLSAVWEAIRAGFFMMVKAMAGAWANFLHNLAGSIQGIPGLDDAFMGLKDAAIGAGSAVYEFQGKAGEALDAAEKLQIDADRLSEQARAPLKSIEDLSNALTKAAEDQEKLFNPATGGGGGGIPADGVSGSGGGGAGAQGGAASQLENELEHRLQALRDYFYTEQELIAQQRAEHLETLELARQAEMLSQQEYNDYKLMVERDFQQKMAAIKAQEFASALDATGDFFGALASMTAGENENLLRIQKVFSAAAALVNTYMAASQALADPRLGFFAKFAAVAAVIAKGMSLVAAIRSGSKSAASGGGATGVNNAPSAAPAQPEVKPMQAVELKMHGEVFTRETVADLIDKINDMGKDGYNIVVRTA